MWRNVPQAKFGDEWASLATSEISSFFVQPHWGNLACDNFSTSHDTAKKACLKVKCQAEKTMQVHLVRGTVFF